jgi:hypothetical protein
MSLSMTVCHESVRPGDRIRISAELIDVLQNDARRHDQVVEVARIERDTEDNTLVLWLRSLPAPGYGADLNPPTPLHQGAITCR